MNKVFLLVVLSLGFIANAQSTLDLTTGTYSSGLSTETHKRTYTDLEDGYRITYKFNKINVIEDDLYSGAFQLSFEDFGQTTTEKLPMLPICGEEYAIPSEKFITISNIKQTYKEFSLTLAPARSATFGETTLTLSEVPAISNYTRYYPSVLVNVERNEFFRNEKNRIY